MLTIYSIDSAQIVRICADRALLPGGTVASGRTLRTRLPGLPCHHQRVFRIDRHEVDGVTLAVRSWPCREAVWPPVVLLPGTGATACDWDVIAAQLCADRTVFAVDLRGHGDSSWPGTYAISLMAGDVTGLLPMLSAAEVDLVGHSLGGLVACQVAASEQSRVRRLVLEDTGMPHPRPAQTPARPAGQLPFDWAVVEQIRPEIDEPDSRWRQVMAAIDVPTLVIGGGTSSFLPQGHVEELAKAVAHATRVSIDAGHLVHATKPGAFLAEVTTFLNSSTGGVLL
jgi:pimeloyl-ACP methyl ester carboxylesterase